MSFKNHDFLTVSRTKMKISHFLRIHIISCHHFTMNTQDIEDLAVQSIPNQGEEGGSLRITVFPFLSISLLSY